MEDDKASPNSSASSVSSRWNPTKEQISMLEALYRQGIRTPSAEQIQQIAGKLREYGSIEGKNVFYWFQNHKARQRQKQKQDSIVYFNRFLRKAAAVAAPPPLLPQPVPLPPPGCANVPVVYSPYYFPQGSGIGYYPQFPQVLLPGAMPRRPAAEFQKMESFKERGGSNFPHPHQYTHRNNEDLNMSDAATHETLELFPVHPTGILEERSMGSLCSVSTESSSLEEEEELGGDDKPVLSFL